MKKTTFKTHLSPFTLVIFSFALLLSPLSAQAYEDVSSSDPAFAAVEYFQEKGVLEKGKYFFPAGYIKRGEFEKLAWNAAGYIAKKDEKAVSKFKDIPSTSPFAPYIQKSLATKIIQWDEESPNYNPNREVTRIEALKFIFDTHGIGTQKLIEKKDIPFSDINYKSSYAPIIKTALNLKLIEGKEKKFEPLKKITRSEAIRYLYKVIQKEDKETNASEIPLQIIQISGDTITNIPGGIDGQNLINHPKFKIFVDVWQKAHHRYVYGEKVDDNKLIYGAIKGMTQELGDKYSVFQEPKQALAFNDSLSGEFEGIGVTIDMIDEKVTVVAPIRNGPAEKAGLRTNDIITKINEKDITGMKLEEVAALIKGPKDTKVTLGILRDKKELSVEIVRKKIKLPVVDGYMKGEIAVIEIHTFNQDTDEKFAQISSELLAKKPKAFIIDVRNNPGGFLDTTLNILDHFVEKGKTLSTLSFKSSESANETYQQGKDIKGRSTMPIPTEVRYLSLGSGELKDYKTIVLQNKGSASASEILAATLRDHGIATIFGDNSFGKGSVQELNNYMDGSQLKLSIAKWLTPNGVNLTENPIKPDKYVKDDPEKVGDEVMDDALATLK